MKVNIIQLSFWCLDFLITYPSEYILFKHMECFMGTPTDIQRNSLTSWGTVSSVSFFFSQYWAQICISSSLYPVTMIPPSITTSTQESCRNLKTITVPPITPIQARIVSPVTGFYQPESSTQLYSKCFSITESMTMISFLFIFYIYRFFHNTSIFPLWRYNDFREKATL